MSAPYTGGELTAEQLADIVALREEWLRIGLSTEPCDRPAAERAVQAALDAWFGPRQWATLWADSPLAGLMAEWGLTAESRPQQRRRSFRQAATYLLEEIDQYLGPIGPTYWPATRQRLEQQLDRIPESLRRTPEPPNPLLEQSLFARLDRELQEQLGRTTAVRLLEELETHLVGPLTEQLHLPLTGALETDFAPWLWESRGMTGLWSAAGSTTRQLRARELAGLPRSAELDALAAGLRSIGTWWVPSQVVVLVDRPQVIRRDAAGRLHHDGGPALAWADGYELCFWHGTALPPHVVTGPPWTPDRILREKNTEVRRCAIERLGWDRFITAAGLVPVGPEVPDPGNPGRRLALYDLPPALGRLYPEPARILLVDNASTDRDGTRRRFGLPVPADVPDALTAAAATFGLDPTEYAGLDRAT